MRFLALIFILSCSTVFAKTVHYDLTLEHKSVNLSGKEEVDFAITVNGGIPAPTLDFTEGDFAEIKVINKLSHEASIHWHGILLPNEMDGVPYVTTPPILAGESYTFRFPIRQSGTYWYHSHTHTQEQKGVYGSIRIFPKQEKYKADHDAVVVLSDWTDENPDQVLKNLKKDGDYYQYKKKSIRSIFGAIGEGKFSSYLGSFWTRMGGMDLSDVGYDAFLINGKKDSQLVNAHPGETVRLRIINAGSSSYFYVSLGQQYFKVISADGQEVSPVETKELLLGMAETYDILFKIPEHKNFELRATAQDVTGFASGWIGMGDKEHVPDRAKPSLYEMHHGDHGGHNMEHMDHTMNNDASHTTAKTSDKSDESAHDSHHMHQETGHDMHQGHNQKQSVPKVESLDYSGLRSLNSTEFGKKIPRYEVRLELDGDMARYVWFINNKVISEDKYIRINKDDIVRFVFVNKTMMHHPMHLHGHFFRVLNAQGDFAPLKHTVDVAPFKTETIEFKADEPGEWMLHCHNLYHMESGMARVIQYKGFTPSSEIQHWQKHDHHDADHWYYTGEFQGFTNQGQIFARASQTRNQLDARIETRRDDEWTAEGDVLARRWMSKYLNLFAGGTAYHREIRGAVGVSYILPLLIESSLYLDTKAKLRLDLDKRLQWTSHIFSDLELKLRDSFEPEWSASLMYGFNWHWAIGAKATNSSVGAGLEARF